MSVYFIFVITISILTEANVQASCIGRVCNVNTALELKNDIATLNDCLPDGNVYISGGVIYLAPRIYELSNTLKIDSHISIIGELDIHDNNNWPTIVAPPIQPPDNGIAFHFVNDRKVHDSYDICSANESKLQHIKIVSHLPTDTTGGGVLIEAAELVKIIDVKIEGFGAALTDKALPADGNDAVPPAPYALRSQGYFVANESTVSPKNYCPADKDCDSNSFGDWNMIVDSTFSNNYRGIVAFSGANGYAKNLAIRNTSGGAAYFMKMDRGLNSIANQNSGTSVGWRFADSQFLYKTTNLHESVNLPDANQLIYLTHKNNLNGMATNSYGDGNSFYNVKTDLTDGAGSDTKKNHAYIRWQRVMMSAHTFVGGKCDVELIDGTEWGSDGNGGNVVNGDVIRVNTSVNGYMESYNRPFSHYFCAYHNMGGLAETADFASWLTNHTDADGDGLPDDYEYAIGTDPFDAVHSSNVYPNQYRDLKIGGYWKNYYRFLHAPYLGFTSDSNQWLDVDNDGLTNYYEYFFAFPRSDILFADKKIDAFDW